MVLYSRSRSSISVCISRVSWDSNPPVFWFSQLAMASSASAVPMGTR